MRSYGYFVSNVIYTHCLRWRIKGAHGGPCPGRHKFFTHLVYQLYGLMGLYDVLNSPRQLESAFKQLKSFCFWGTWSLETQFQSKFSHFSHLISIHTWTWAWACSFLNHVSIKFMLASNMHQKDWILLLHLSKGISFWRTFVAGKYYLIYYIH